LADQLKTETGSSLSAKKPWWAVALLSGFGAGLALAGALGLPSMQAHGQEPPPVRSSSVTLPPGSISLDDRLRSIEGSLKALSEDMADVKARLPPRK
jgi:hypothetical protein